MVLTFIAKKKRMKKIIACERMAMSAWQIRTPKPNPIMEIIQQISQHKGSWAVWIMDRKKQSMDLDNLQLLEAREDFYYNEELLEHDNIGEQ